MDKFSTMDLHKLIFEEEEEKIEESQELGTMELYNQLLQFELIQNAQIGNIEQLEQQFPDQSQLDPDYILASEIQEQFNAQFQQIRFSSVYENNQRLIKIQSLNLESQNQVKRFEEQMKKQQNCLICLESLEEIKNDKALIQLDNCQHIFCQFTCLAEHVKHNIKDMNFPILCPVCKLNLNQQNITAVLTRQEDVIDFHQKELKHYGESNPEMSWCPTPDCKYMFEYKNNGLKRDFKCKLCKKSYCLNCRVEKHVGLTCQQYKDQKLDEPFLAFVKGKKFKQCGRCNFWVEKNEGCNHMTCRCKYEFCYICGGKYPHNEANPCKGS